MIILIIYTILKILAIVVPLLISVAYFTIAERKIMGIIQRRRGPNVIGFVGLLQPLADGLKLFAKETILPSNSNIIIFLIAPILSFLLSLISWSVIPLSETIVLSDINVGILYLFATSSLSVYGIIMAGWSSNSKYPFFRSIKISCPNDFIRDFNRIYNCKCLCLRWII
jgi:NADH-quinone oxidoreductase subunit H